MRRALFPVVALVLLLSAGCSRISYDKTLTLDAGQEELEVEFKAPKSEQKVTVKATCDVEISVYLALMDDKHEVVVPVHKGKKPTGELDYAEKTKETSLEGKVPAGKGFFVLIRREDSKEKIQVKLDVQGR